MSVNWSIDPLGALTFIAGVLILTDATGELTWGRFGMVFLGLFLAGTSFTYRKGPSWLRGRGR